MKASITISDMVGIFGVIVLVILFVTQIIPTLFSTLIQSFAESSAENVARQLSGLITVSGSAPYQAQINYTPTSDAVYQIVIDSKTIKVVPKFQTSYEDKSSSTQSFAVNLPNSQSTGVNSFLIKKNFIDGESSYAFSATKQ